MGRIGPLLAAGGYAAEGIVVLLHRGADFHGGFESRLLDLAYAVAVLASAAALPGLTAWLRVRRARRIASRAAQVGFVAMGVESGVGVVHRVDALGPLFGVGLLLSLAGLAVLAVDGALVTVPRWVATLPLLAVVVSAAGGEVGASIVSALLWLALTRILSAAERPSAAHAVPVPSS
jgi:hypothetical protein